MYNYLFVIFHTHWGNAGEIWAFNEDVLFICACASIALAMLFLNRFLVKLKLYRTSKLERHGANKSELFINGLMIIYCIFLFIWTFLFLLEIINNANILLITLLIFPTPLISLIIFIYRIIKLKKLVGCDSTIIPLFVLIWSTIYAFFALNWSVGYIG